MVFDKVSTRYVSLMLTHKCNLNCVYCYELFKSSATMDVDNAKQYIKQAFENTFTSGKYNALELSMMGGEPLLEFFKIKEICEWLWNQEWPMKYIVFASTNGTLLTDDMKKWFSANKDKIVLGISLDGQPASQAFNRGDLATTIDIDFFVRTWPEQGIKSTVSRESLKSLSNDVIYLHKFGFKTIYANLAFGIDWQKDDLIVLKEQLLKLVDFYIENPQYERCSLLNMDLCSILDSSSEYEKYCGCGEGTICIDTDGQEYPCPVFSPITQPQKNLYIIKNIDFSDPKVFLDSKCNGCLLWKNCPKCYGMNLFTMGNPAQSPEFNCKAYKIQVLANCVMQNKLLEYGKIEDNKKQSLNNVLNLLEYIFTNQTTD